MHSHAQPTRPARPPPAQVQARADALRQVLEARGRSAEEVEFCLAGCTPGEGMDVCFYRMDVLQGWAVSLRERGRV